MKKIFPFVFLILSVHMMFCLAGCADQINEASLQTSVETETGEEEDVTSVIPETEFAPTEEEVLPERYEVGEQVTFGEYGGEGIAWIVLEENADGALLWTKFCIDARQYNNGGLEDVSWETCTLRQWLNTDFMEEAFDEEERKHIVRSKIANMDCGETEDCVFILSAQELEEYAGEHLIGYPTGYAENNGLLVNNGMFSDSDRGKSWYWIRGNHEGQPSAWADWIDVKGEVRYNMNVSDDTVGVRPAFWYSYAELETEQRPGISDYVIKDSGKRYLAKEDLQGLSAEELRLARNEIYARHGYRFKDQALNEYFTSKAWYYPESPDSRFCECLLNIYEKNNVQMILAAEEGREYDGGLLRGYGEISESAERKFSGDIDLAFFEKLCGTWGTQSGEVIVSITPERFNGYPCRLLKFEYNDINLWYEIVFEVYYEDEIRIMELTRFLEEAGSPGGFEMAYYDANGKKLTVNGYEVENDRFEVEYVEEQ